MKIVVVGLGYVGLANAVLLAQHNEVVGVDVARDRVDALNRRESPIVDAHLSEHLSTRNLKLSATTDLENSVIGADYIIVSTPTNYNEETNSFDTSTVEAVITKVTKSAPDACIVIKSTIPVGFVEDVRTRLKTNAVIFSPEFLREGKALYDNLHPSRIIVGEKSDRAQKFANLLAQGALKSQIEILLTGSREAEAIKLFANAYLAMRVAFFNEVDSYALTKDINIRDIIDGVSLDPRIGKHYNNPSFGYGGYCLPKDTKQLLTEFKEIPHKLITAVIDSNETRKKVILNKILEGKPSKVGIYKISMKHDSDNYRQSAVLDICTRLLDYNIDVSIYDPSISSDKFLGMSVVNDLNKFISTNDLIVANRIPKDLKDAHPNIFSRDLFERD